MDTPSAALDMITSFTHAKSNSSAAALLPSAASHGKLRPSQLLVQ